MQLKKPKSIRKALMLATCTMLSTSPQAAEATESEQSWDIDSALLLYSETDRVSVAKAVVSASQERADDEFIAARLVIDSLTGSSANGAVPTAAPQTFTTPSGKSTYTTAANEVPLDSTFIDLRVAGSVEWEKPLDERSKGIYSLNLSTEHDYTSVGIGSTFTRDYNNQLTTLTAGLSLSFDSVKPEGGIPTGLAKMPDYPLVKDRDSSEEGKTVIDMLVGVTQIINRQTLMQFNYAFGKDDGYLTDPYKIVSVVDTNGDLIAAGDRYIYEKRPDSRVRNALYWKTKHQFTDDVIALSYRYYWDDWGINSHTVDLHYHFEINSKHYLQPHLRFYSQAAADFYTTSLLDGENVQYSSADYRLGDMDTVTIGAKYGMALDNDSEFAIRVEVMQQSSTPNRVIGIQSEQDLTPDVEAIIIQFNYTTTF